MTAKNAASFLCRSFCNFQSVLLGQVSTDLRILFPAAMAGCQLMQSRGRYIDWRMWRDVKRRRMYGQYYDERLRVNAIRKNTIIPKVLQEIADKEIDSFPRDSCRTRAVNRCVVTSRPRGVKQRWRLSRIVWRSLADYNKLSGVTRSWW